MTTKQLNVERVCYVSRKPFREILEVLDAGIGHPNMEELWRNIFKANTVAEVDDLKFLRFNHGDIVHKGKMGGMPGIIRLVVGNPSIMRRMAEHVPDAGSYAPVTILIDERLDGVHLSYDRVASFLATYKNEEALKVARELDAKVEGLLASID